jgi:hypothetical protein
MRIARLSFVIVDEWEMMMPIPTFRGLNVDESIKRFFSGGAAGGDGASEHPADEPEQQQEEPAQPELPDPVEVGEDG